VLLIEPTVPEIDSAYCVHRLFCGTRPRGTDRFNRLLGARHRYRRRARRQRYVRRLSGGGSRIRTLGSPPKVNSVHPGARRDPRRHREARNANRSRRRARRAICGGSFHSRIALAEGAWKTS
jgi:hypothetical protein